MRQRHARMPIEHARPCIAHHGLDPGPHLYLVAMNGTLGAYGFICLKRTMVQTLVHIVRQFLAGLTEPIGNVWMMIVTVHVDHHPYRVELFLYFSMHIPDSQEGRKIVPPATTQLASL